MVVRRFPNPLEASPEGLLAVGGDLQGETLLLAYSQGIFPWPIEGLGLAWFCPDPRAILEFGDLHVSTSLKKFQRKHPYRLSFDEAFDEVISHCASQPRPGQDGTWITDDMSAAFRRFHRRGHAHSVEVWEGKNLVGGVYGVCVKGVFCAESMFHLKPNASKIALLFLIDYLVGKGATWMDIQVMTPHMKALGAKEIPRDEFLQKLQTTQQLKQTIF